MSVNGYSQAATPSMRVPVKRNSVALSGSELNSASEYNTDWVAPKGARRVGLFIEVATEDSSSATLDIDIEQSPDKGTNIVDMPQAANSQTKASFTQITATGTAFKWFEHCGDGQFTRVRAELTQGGLTASEGLTYGSSFWFFSDVD